MTNEFLWYIKINIFIKMIDIILKCIKVLLWDWAVTKIIDLQKVITMKKCNSRFTVI